MAADDFSDLDASNVSEIEDSDTDDDKKEFDFAPKSMTFKLEIPGVKAVEYTLREGESLPKKIKFKGEFFIINKSLQLSRGLDPGGSIEKPPSSSKSNKREECFGLISSQHNGSTSGATFRQKEQMANKADVLNNSRQNSTLSVSTPTKTKPLKNKLAKLASGSWSDSDSSNESHERRGRNSQSPDSETKSRSNSVPTPSKRKKLPTKNSSEDVMGKYSPRSKKLFRCSLSPSLSRIRQRSESRSSVSSNHKRQRSGSRSSVSPNRKRQRSRSRSPVSPNRKRQRSRSRSPVSPNRKRQRSRSRSPVSPNRKRQRSRSRSPVSPNRKRQRSRSKSPVSPNRKRQRSGSKSRVASNRKRQHKERPPASTSRNRQHSSRSSEQKKRASIIEYDLLEAKIEGCGKCPFCDFGVESSSNLVIFDHVKAEHQNWQEALATLNDDSSDSEVGNDVGKFNKFFDSFKEKLKLELSKSTRVAFEKAEREGKLRSLREQRKEKSQKPDNDEDEMKLKGKVKSKQRNEILTSSVEMVYKAFGVKAEKVVFERVVSILQESLPWEFKHVETVELPDGLGKVCISGGRGLGGKYHNQSLLKSVQSKFFEKYRRKPGSKDGRRQQSAKKNSKAPYSLIPEKYHAEAENETKSQNELNNAKDKSPEEVSACIKNNRAYIQTRIRNMKTLDLKHFLEDDMKVFGGSYENISEHFTWLTNSDKLSTKFEEVFNFETRNLERYLNDKYDDLPAATSKRFYDDKKIVSDNCDSQGNKRPMFLFLIREFAIFHKEAPELVFRYSDEEASNLPYIHESTEANDKYELMQGETILFKNMTLTKAFSVLIEFYFVFHLNFPKKAEKTFDFLQRICMRFGLDTGGKAQSKKPTKPIDDYKLCLYKYMK